jgi:dihydrofolate synthase / folylpolyglutamate synthase
MSDNPPNRRLQGRISALVERLHALYPVMIDLGTGRLLRLLADLGNPHFDLPPVIHVAGTNGKGSTCAFLRAMGEAAGSRVHVYTSPHLVRFNERIRIAGDLVSDEALEATFEEIEQINAGREITVFEVLTAAALLLFSRNPAELCVLEVGLGGRHDATNVVPRPAACAIASISMDHRDFLGGTLAKIAGEKAGIVKPGVPAVTGWQTAEAMAVLREEAASKRAPLLARDEAWSIEPYGESLRYQDSQGTLILPQPGLAGAFQHDNAGIALAALRAADLGLPGAALAQGVASASWPARMQRLTGRLGAMLPEGWELWLDGGHNPGGGEALAAHLAGWRDKPAYVIVGMKRSKDAAEFLRPIIPLAASLWAVAEPEQHSALAVEDIVAASGGVALPGPVIADALAQIPRDRPARVLICGSLYLAGEALKLDSDIPPS